ncbi:MAG: SPOR domain-containing protein [Ignavibacteria bacterium]
MKNRKYSFLIIIALFLTYAGCSSSSDDVNGASDTLDMKDVVEQQNGELKETTSATENKFRDKEEVSYTYEVQLGAYQSEVNAEVQSSTAKLKFANKQVSLKNVDNMFKINMSGFKNREEAMDYLAKAIEEGFTDSFVIELKYLMHGNK